MKDVNKRRAFVCYSGEEKFVHSCGFGASTKEELDEHLETCERCVHPLPEPTYTRAQVKEIIEQVVIGVSLVFMDVDSRETEDGDWYITTPKSELEDEVYKAIRETEI